MPLSEKAQQNKTEYNLKYAKSHYKRVPLDVSLDKYDEIKAAADTQGETLNGYIKKAIDMRLKKGK